MKKGKWLLCILIFVLIAFVLWKFVFTKVDNNTSEISASSVEGKQNSALDQSISTILVSYFEMSEAFVNWDSDLINQKADSLKILVDSLNLQAANLDSTNSVVFKNYQNLLGTEISGLSLETDIYEKRLALNSLSHQLFEFLKATNYSGYQVYFQECPMAFNNYEKSAFWLSTDASFENRRNPYLGLSDPKYGKGMLHCGQTKDSLILN